MKLSTVQQEFSYDIAKLIVFAYERGIGLTFGEAHRPQSMQVLYYYGWEIVEQDDDAVMKQAPVRTKTLNSSHKRRLAVDFFHFINGRLVEDRAKLQELGDYWEALRPGKNRWGGNYKSFTDVPHYERLWK